MYFHDDVVNPAVAPAVANLTGGEGAGSGSAPSRAGICSPLQESTPYTGGPGIGIIQAWAASAPSPPFRSADPANGHGRRGTASSWIRPSAYLACNLKLATPRSTCWCLSTFAAVPSPFSPAGCVSFYQNPNQAVRVTRCGALPCVRGTAVVWRIWRRVTRSAPTRGTAS